MSCLKKCLRLRKFYLTFPLFTKVNIAGIKLKLKTLNITVPNAIRPPKTLTGIMFMNKSTAKPAAVASAV